MLLESQALGEWGFYVGAEAGEEAVEAEECAVQVDGVGGASLSSHATEGVVFSIFFAEVVDGFHEGGVAKVEAAGTEGQGEEFEGFLAEIDEVGALSGGVRG